MSIPDLIEFLANVTDIASNAIFPAVAYIAAKKENGPSKKEGPKRKEIE